MQFVYGAMTHDGNAKCLAPPLPLALPSLFTMGAVDSRVDGDGYDAKRVAGSRSPRRRDQDDQGERRHEGGVSRVASGE